MRDLVSCVKNPVRPPLYFHFMTPPSRLRAILWDNDGVLVNTERLFYQANREYFREWQIDLTAENFFDWFLKDNRGAWHLLDLPPDKIALCRAQRNGRYHALLLQAQGLQSPGVEALLCALTGRVRMGIVTSARREDFNAIHSRLALLPHFEFVIAEGDYALSKPAPDPYLLGLERLGLSAQQCLVIEDSPRGLASALAAGIDCIVIRSDLTANCAFGGARAVVESFEQLQDVLLTLC
jgi:HAD superfamily hydrolase (TIGR01509 family)